jgi:hypothetical protein
MAKVGNLEGRPKKPKTFAIGYADTLAFSRRYKRRENKTKSPKFQKTLKCQDKVRSKTWQKSVAKRWVKS